MAHTRKPFIDMLTAISQSSRDLVVLDKDADTWRRHPWQQVYGLAEVIASRVADRAGERSPTVGLVGEPTAAFVASLPAAWIAGGRFTIAAAPVRGADSARWARATLDRFAEAGVTSILGHGPALQLLRASAPAVAVDDLAEFDSRRGDRLSAKPEVAQDHIAILQSTAGSTGVAQTVAVGAEAVLANIDGVGARFAVERDDVTCSWLPLYHDMGLMFLLYSMVHGLEMWLAPTSAFSASPFRWLDWLTTSRAAMTAAPNFAYNLLGHYSRRITHAELSSLRIAITGGEPVDCEGFERFATEMGRFGFPAGACALAYGLAESACAVTIPARGAGLRYEPGPVKCASLGAPIDGMHVRIDTDVDHGLSADVGEVQIRGTSMMTGYLGSAPLQPGAWFPTGDLGYLRDNELVVCGRIKEVIHLAGRNIFPTDVERVAAGVDGLRNGCVVATEVPAAAGSSGLAVVAEYRGSGPAAVRQRLVERIAAECGVVAAAVELVAPGSLPRTTSGKLRRLEVGRKLRAGELAVQV